MDEFKGKLGNYKIIKTEDLTETVWSEFFDEACHNLSGAKEETIFNYINGCQLAELFSENKLVHILDVGFGIGMGLTCLIEFIEAHSFHSQIVHYTSIELDDELANWSLNKFHLQINLEIRNEDQLTYLEGQYKNIHIIILLGDGRITLPMAISRLLIPNFHAIFQDAFSPKKNPTLWTTEWFQFLRNSSDQNVKMATYSAAMGVRKSMVEAGWIISNHKGFGLKKSMTKAKLIGEMTKELLDQLARSPAIPSHDLE